MQQNAVNFQFLNFRIFKVCNGEFDPITIFYNLVFGTKGEWFHMPPASIFQKKLALTYQA